MYDVTLLNHSQEGKLRKYAFLTCGLVCSTQIDIDVEDDTIRRVKYTNGCNGNTQGVAALCVGRKVKDVIDMLEGIDCKGRGTSCPDQLARALKQCI